MTALYFLNTSPATKAVSYFNHFGEFPFLLFSLDLIVLQKHTDGFRASTLNFSNSVYQRTERFTRIIVVLISQLTFQQLFQVFEGGENLPEMPPSFFSLSQSALIVSSSVVHRSPPRHRG